MTGSQVQRMVGIDFGTSTSLIRVKRYANGQPIGGNFHSNSVTYGNGTGDSQAETLVRENPDHTWTCGEYGREELPGGTVYREFKMDLQSKDPQKRKKARELTQAFFRYLYEYYHHQESSLGEAGDQVQTILSYPAKWTRETVSFMQQTALEAGFPNVSSMDEPSAALYAVICQKMEEVTAQGLLMPGQSGYALLVDMGAGTTDLAVCRFEINDKSGVMTAEDRVKTRIISSWPDESSPLTFGGREVDRILEDYLISYLQTCGLSKAEALIRGKTNVKLWKEKTVSACLGQNQPVTSCSFVSQFVSILGAEIPFPTFDRQKFEEMLHQQLADFKELIQGCLWDTARKEPALLAGGLDLVLLTGGHSSWYFVEELLNGTMPGLQNRILDRVQREKQRVLRLPNPQETVALGMVYSRLPFALAAPAQEVSSLPEAQPGQMPRAPQPSAPPDGRTYAQLVKNFLDTWEPQTIYHFNQRLPVTVMAYHLGVPASDIVYMAHDDSMLHSGMVGTIYTDQGIYTRKPFATTVFTDWKTFMEGTITQDAAFLMLMDPKTGQRRDIGYFVASMQEALRICHALQQALRTAFGAE